MRILLTGFGPFGDVVDNPSARIALHLGDRGHADQMITTRVLPVSFRRADTEIRNLLCSDTYDLALLIGVAGNAAQFRLETLAANEDSARIPDCDGEWPQDTAIVEGFVESLDSPFDVATIQRALVELGFPVDISSNAGRYVCNRTYFAALHEVAASRLATQCLFLHVPPDERTFAEPNGRATVAFTQQIEFACRLLDLLTSGPQQHGELRLA